MTDVKKFFNDMLIEFKSTELFKIVSKIVTDVNSRFVFVFFVLYATFTITQTLTPSKLPFQTNMLVGISLFITLQILFSKISSDFAIYEPMFATTMIIAVTVFLAILFTIGNKWNESMQITSITTCVTFILAYYVARYYLVFQDGKINFSNKSSTSDSLFKALLCSFAVGVFVLGLTREYNEADPSYKLDVENDYLKTKKKADGITDETDSKGDKIWVVPVYIYIWNNADGGRRYVGEVIESNSKGISVQFEKPSYTGEPVTITKRISWRELKEKGSSLLIHRTKNADGTEDLGKCGTYKPINLKK